MQLTELSSRLAYAAAELADAMGVSERHIWAMHADGRLGPLPISFGRAKRWNVQEVRDWLNAGAPPRSEWQLRNKS